MKKLFLLFAIFSTVGARAQDKKSLDSVDKVIIGTIIRPAEQNAGGQEPNWTAIQQQIRASYSEVQTDRAVTKAQDLLLLE